MAHDPTLARLEDAIRAKLPEAFVRVTPGAGGGHYAIEVASTAFAGLSRLESQRLVYAAIAHLMQGDAAPVHAIDTLKTRAT